MMFGGQLTELLANRRTQTVTDRGGRRQADKKTHTCKEIMKL